MSCTLVLPNVNFLWYATPGLKFPSVVFTVFIIIIKITSKSYISIKTKREKQSAAAVRWTIETDKEAPAEVLSKATAGKSNAVNKNNSKKTQKWLSVKNWRAASVGVKPVADWLPLGAVARYRQSCNNIISNGNKYFTFLKVLLKYVLVSSFVIFYMSVRCLLSLNLREKAEN